ncbi:hypothetical protein [Roseinatronobacter alkalisoli]|uniref:Lipopolysaccharide export system protein LptC n=1 Tax=Roseinatronobacter alkalisoli TaxID=3028235 RepID=A0ABT5T704_9RHOB|nr:hypothetical protein [Roseinatronobacter sp. HJB301]MDD7970460.1 hypothetical protein [Roseinatronobacter sp. HJB301]
MTPHNMANLRYGLALTLRLVLPLGALVLLSTIFLVSRSPDPSQAVALADIDIDELTREPRIGTARFAAVTAQNAAITIAARTVRSPANPQPGEPVTLLLDYPEGSALFTGDRQVDFRADHGVFDQMADTLTMTGSVRMHDASGYEIGMARLQAQLDRSQLAGTGGISGHGPAGEISAQSLTITPLSGTDGGYMLDFRGDVRLLYTPTD